ISGDYSIYRSQVPTRKDSPAHRGEFNTPILADIKVKEIPLRDIKININKNVRETQTIMNIHKIQFSSRN
ncbi:MAG: chloride channel protein, partial [Thermoplasmata archaeon]